MAILPFSASKCFYKPQVPSNTVTSFAESTKSNSDIKDKDFGVLCGITAAVCKKSYCGEAVKAIAILINTDYSAQPENFDLNDKSVYLKEDNISDKEYYAKVKNAVNSVKELYLINGKEKSFVPYNESSCGYTLNSEKNDSIISVASPWDCFFENYDKNTECIGVSLSGLNYLCQNGAKAEDALKWYLPNFEIKKSAS